MTEETQITEMAGESLRKVPPEIIKARLNVMKDAHGVGKSGRNAFHNYDYASDFDVLSLVQPSMAKHGLMLEMWPDKVKGPDENGNFSVLFMMQWQHEGGAVADPIPWWGIAQDRDKQGRVGDKWFNKAATAAEKYFLLKQFHIPAAKDMDPDKGAAENHPPPSGRTTGTPADTKKNGKQIQVMRAVDGSIQTFPATKGGALEAVAHLEDLAGNYPENWQVNEELAKHLIATIPHLQADPPDGPTIKMRLEALRDRIEGGQTIMDAG